MPVTMGNADPPICPMTKMGAKAVGCISGRNSLEATGMPCWDVGGQSGQGIYQVRAGTWA
jgi:hypothetical protein